VFPPRCRDYSGLRFCFGSQISREEVAIAIGNPPEIRSLALSEKYLALVPAHCRNGVAESLVGGTLLQVTPIRRRTSRNSRSDIGNTIEHVGKVMLAV